MKADRNAHAQQRAVNEEDEGKQNEGAEETVRSQRIDMTAAASCA